MESPMDAIKELSSHLPKSEKRYKKLTLLHSNDLHGDFLAEQIDENLVGGVSRLSGYINRARQEDPNVVYAISGDMFRGSVIDSEFKGISTIEIMNLLGPDVVTIGNHEIDYGVPHLLFIERCANFPIVNANFRIKTNNRRLFEPQYVLEIDGIKILFIGVVTEEVIASAKSDELIGTFLDVKEASEEIGKICNAYNRTDIDFTVLLTHIGFEEDKALAERLDPAWGVDLIIGGHSHTLLEEPAVVNGIPIVQVGMGTDQIGRFDIVVDTKKNAIDSYTWQCIPLNENTAPADQVLEDLILNYKGITDNKYCRILTRFLRPLTHPSRIQETELGNLVADALRESLGVDLMLSGSGSIRLPQMGPVVTLGNLNETFPYDDALYQVSMTGEQLQRAFQHIFRDEAWEGHTEFYQVSVGTRLVYNKQTKQFEVFEVCGQPVDPQRIYTVAMQKYHFQNLQDFLNVSLEECEKNAPCRTLSTSTRDVLEEYFVSHSNLDSKVEGRMVIK